MKPSSNPCIRHENRSNILFEMPIEDHGTLLLRVVTIDEESGRVEFAASIKEYEEER